MSANSSDLSTAPRCHLHVGLCEELFEKLENCSVDLVITSPPYGIGKSYEETTTVAKYKKWAENVVEHVARVVRVGGAVCWQVGNHIENGNVYPLDVLYLPLFLEHGFVLKNRIVWKFGHGMHSKKRLSGRYEVCLWLVKGSNSTCTFNLDEVREPSKEPAKRAYKGPRRGSLSGNPLGKNPSDVWQLIRTELVCGEWDFPNVKSNHIEKSTDIKHPCQFPIELAERCVLAFSNEDDTILDPFVGSGSTAVASVFHRRRFIGFDKSEKYIALSRQRIEAARLGKLGFRRIGTPISQAPVTSKSRTYPHEWIDTLKQHSKRRRIVETKNQSLASTL